MNPDDIAHLFEHADDLVERRTDFLDLLVFAFEFLEFAVGLGLLESGVFLRAPAGISGLADFVQEGVFLVS